MFCYMICVLRTWYLFDKCNLL